MQTLITNIALLVNTRTENSLLRGKALAELPCIENAFLVIEDGLIKDYGSMQSISNLQLALSNQIDAKGATVLPTWVDSHTHLVFAASRENEFVDKLKGKTYAEIAASGGGILNSAKRIASSTEDELYASANERLHELIKLGTGAIEIKSGYVIS